MIREDRHFLISSGEYILTGKVKKVEKESRINRISEVLAIFPAVRVAYVYGSVLTRDDFRDIDIALFLDEALSDEDQVSAAEVVGFSLEEALSFSHVCDIKILNDAPVWFQYEVIRHGRPVYARTDGERFDRETSILIAYLDMKYSFDLFDHEYLARV